MDLAKDFVFQPLPPTTQSDAQAQPLAATASKAEAVAATPVNLGRLADLRGKWEGTGFNTIWRPLFNVPGQEDFLELNLTSETLEVDEIQGAIPNRGFVQSDIEMFGVHYLQQISDKNLGTGLHFEPGMWLHVPATTHPSLSVTVVRMATIPHGTAIVAQGPSSSADETVKPDIPKIDIFPLGGGDTANSGGDVTAVPEMDLKSKSKFRTSGAGLTGITQAMILDPNSVLRAAIAGQNITSTTRLQVTTSQVTLGSGGVANTAFLNGGKSGDENATAAKVTSTFWLERLDGEKVASQLQYSQRVLLTFNGTSWPHVTVGTLRRVS
jgi:hypothetical protein